MRSKQSQILLDLMKRDQNVISEKKVTGDQLGKSDLVFPSFTKMFKKYDLVETFVTIIKNDNTMVMSLLGALY